MKFGATLCIIAVFCLAATIPSSAQTFTTLFSFDGTTNGQGPNAPLLQATNGDFYGTTGLGGTADQGGIFGITPGGELAGLSMFSGCSGCPGAPSAGLIQGPNGIVYGTALGGANVVGAVYKVMPNGVVTTIYSFCAQSFCPDGQYPETLVFGPNGNLYGAASYGGVSGECDIQPVGCGTIFEITPAGQFTKLYDFCSQTNCSDGTGPAALVLATNGKFYGSASSGGNFNGDCSTGCGTIFEITPAGNLTTLYTFCSVTNAKGFCADGESPGNGLIQGTDGNFYGATLYGGASNNGTLFRITPQGELTTLYNFCSQTNCTDGRFARGLVQGTDGNLYGAAGAGGANNGGTLFEFTRAGQFTTLYNFCSQTNCTDGSSPEGPLLQATDGAFYGSAITGGSSNCRFGCGTLFSLSTGLGPFVKTNPGFGKVGMTINILGNNLMGTTSVTFNGTAATFTVVSDTYIKAQVPTGATTGTIEVTTPSGTLSSNVAFQVIP